MPILLFALLFFLNSFYLYARVPISTSLLKCQNLQFAVHSEYSMYKLLNIIRKSEFMDSNLLQCDTLVAVLLLVAIA